MDSYKVKGLITGVCLFLFYLQGYPQDSTLVQTCLSLVESTRSNKSIDSCRNIGIQLNEVDLISRCDYRSAILIYQEDLEQAYKYSANAYRLRINSEDKEPEFTIRCGYNAAYFAKQLGMSDSVQYFYTEVVKSDIINSTSVLARKDLGKYYADEGNISLAKGYIKQAISYRSHLNNNHTFDLYLDHSMVLINEIKFSANEKKEILAHQIISTAEGVFDSIDLTTIDPIDLAGYYQNVGWAYRYISDYNKAIEFTHKGLKLNIPPELEANLSNNLGIFFKLLNQYEKSIEHLKIAEEKYLSINEKFGVVQAFDNFGETYTAMGQFDDAINYFNKGICTLIPQSENCFDLDLNDLHKISTLPSLLRIWVLTLLDDKARCYYQWYQQENQVEKLNLSLRYYTLADNVVSLIQKSVPQESSQLNWRSRAKDLYESAVEVALQADSFELVHKYMERSKAVVLYQAIQQSYATDLLDNKVEKEISFTRIGINNLQSVLFDIGDENSSKALAIKDSILRLESQYNILIDEVAKVNPTFYQLNYNDDNIGMNTVKEKLNDDQSLISFFTTETKVIGIALNNQSTQFKDLGEKGKIDSIVSEYNALLNDFIRLGNISDSDYLSYLNSFTNSSNELYQVLLDPWENLKDNVIIIPSENLGEISFEGLLMNKPDLSTPIKEWSFVIKDHSISYSPSITIWDELQEKQSKGNDLITFTPKFSGSSYVSLNETQAKLKESIPHFNVINYNGKEANIENLMAYNGEAMINLATHAVIDPNQSEYSFLLLNDNLGSLDTIFLKDIYHIDIPGAFVVINACESSRGALSRGEGIISLERAFTYAGASGLITSLWPINDHASSIIMKNFYENIGDHYRKDQALRQAKLSYLSEIKTEIEAHPYLWAPLVHIGNSEALDVNTASFNNLWFIFGFFLIALVSYVLIIKNQRARNDING